MVYQLLKWMLALEEPRVMTSLRELPHRISYLEKDECLRRYIYASNISLLAGAVRVIMK